MVPFAPKSILEIGCGPGMATMSLAKATDARILATDTDEGALDRLRDRVVAKGLGERVEVRNVDMAQLPVPEQPWDVIWAEGSAYIIGVERAMRDWKRLLRPGGVLVFSEMVWRTDAPSDALRAYWASEYPAMTRVPVRLEQAKRAGYRVLGHFDMGREAMDSYYQPLEARVAQMEARLEGTRVLDDLRAELAAYHACDGIASFEMFLLQKP
jgi:ubiquinone/menaquinone biosynthesis C-methylase UbiE